MLPISYFGWALAAWGYGISLDPLSPIYTLLACMFGYVLFLLLNKILRIKVNKYIWYFPVYLGVLLAVFNSISLTSLADSEEFITFAASYFVGDVMGMFVFLFLVMFAFRYIRKFKQLPNEY